MSNDLITRLRQQADELEAAQKQVASVKPIPQPLPTTPQSIQDMIAAEIAKQMAPPVNPMATMLSLLGQAFNKDQQLWISGNLDKLPAFIQSPNGKAALNMLLEEFQTFAK